MPHMNELIELLKRSKDWIDNKVTVDHHGLRVSDDIEDIKGYRLSADIETVLHEFEILKVGHLART